MLEKTRTSWLDEVTGFGTIGVEPLEWLALEFICFNMRAQDREEIFCNLPSDNPLEFAAMLHGALARNGCGWIARFNGRPVAALGVAENFTGNWQVFSFGTAQYGRALVAFKPKIDAMFAFARERGMHRLECKSIISHREAHRFIRLIGLRPEATLKKYGKRGQDYVLFARTW